jgi:geranylgeranyl reductase family protein
MNHSYDIVVVGAGPAGAAAALAYSRLGLGQVALVDKNSLGRPKTCGGGLSPRARKVLKEIGLWEPVAGEAYSIRGLRLVSSNGKEVSLAGDDTASVMARCRFDRILVEEAVRSGAEFIPETRIDGLEMQNGRVVGVRSAGGVIQATWVVLASGANTRNEADPRPARLLQSCMAWYVGVPFTPGILEMVYDPDLAPHYGWLFPESAERVNIGICIAADRLEGRSVRRLFETFLDRHYRDRLAEARQDGPFRGHRISTTVGIEHNAPPGVLLAGEANRLTNVATGEGISYAIQSGFLAAQSIATGKHRRWDAERTAADYASSLGKAFGLAFRSADMFLRYGMRTLNGMTALGNNAFVRAAIRRTMARL